LRGGKVEGQNSLAKKPKSSKKKKRQEGGVLRPGVKVCQERNVWSKGKGEKGRTKKKKVTGAKEKRNVERGFGGSGGGPRIETTEPTQGA